MTGTSWGKFSFQFQTFKFYICSKFCPPLFSGKMLHFCDNFQEKKKTPDSSSWLDWLKIKMYKRKIIRCANELWNIIVECTHRHIKWVRYIYCICGYIILLKLYLNNWTIRESFLVLIVKNLAADFILLVWIQIYETW